MRRRLLMGTTVAALASATGVALVGLAGWFITTCAIVGALGTTTFSWVFPSAGIRALAVGRTVGRYGERVTNHATTLAALAELRTALFAGALRLPAVRLRELRSGDLLARVTSDVDALDLVILRVLVPVLSGLLVALAGVGFLVIYSVPVAVAALAGLVLGGLGTSGIALRLGRRPGNELVTARAVARAELVAAIDGRPELISYGAEDAAHGRLLGAFGRVSAAKQRAILVDAGAQAAVALSSGAALLTVLMLASGMQGQRAVAPAVATMLSLAVLGLFEAVETLPAALREWGNRAAAARRLTLLFQPAHERASGRAPRAPGGELSVAGVAVDYGAGRELCLPELHVRCGGFIVLSGPSGAGKSTLLKLLAGELAPLRGRVTVVDSVAHVAQDSHVFDGTLASNLLLAAPSASNEELRAALWAVALTGLVSGLAQGLQTPVGAHGERLSGGQRRRLSVAQALLRHPDVLLLDEPTDGLDDRTARQVLMGVREWLPDATIVVALHDRVAGHLPWPPDEVISLAGHQPWLERTSRSWTQPERTE